MKRIIFGLIACLIAMPAAAQVKSPIYIDRNGSYQGAQGTVCINPDATPCPAGTAADPVFTSPPAGASSTQVQGDVAAAATDSGNPVKVGALVVTGTISAASAGNRANLTTDLLGNVRTLAAGVPITPTDGGAVAIGYTSNNKPAALGGPLAVLSYVWNGATTSVQRGDTVGTFTLPTPTASATNAITTVSTSAVASSLVGKGSAGNLYGVNVVTGASAGFIMVFNATSAPADGAVTPVRCLPIAANTGLELDFREIPVAFSTGITVVFSTTGCFAKLASATAFLAVDAK